MPRTIIIGDIHGCWDELRDLFDAVALTDDDLVVSVGDLVDRGPVPGAVVDFFRARRNSVVLCGNHERKHIRGVFSYSQEVARLQMGASYAEQVAWMATLPYHYETPEVRVVHWGHFPGVPLEQVPEDVRAGTTSGDGKLRARYGERPWYEHYEDDVPIAFGHAVYKEPLVLRDRVFGLDTGACHGGALTALVMPERRVVSVPARADHWERVRREWTVPVLRTHAWPTMPFEQIDKKVRAPRDPEMSGDFLDQVGAWAAAVRALLPTLLAALEAETARIEAETPEFGRTAAAHPAAKWLLRLREGKLSKAHLGCATPADVFTLARALGVPTEVAEAP